mgnify:CR=1 FL=1
MTLKLIDEERSGKGRHHRPADRFFHHFDIHYILKFVHASPQEEEEPRKAK